MVSDAAAQGADGLPGSAAGYHSKRRAFPSLGSQSWGYDSSNPHLHPTPGLENTRWHCSPEESSHYTPAEMPQGTALFLTGLGVGWKDRQTDRDIQ